MQTLILEVCVIVCESCVFDMGHGEVDDQSTRRRQTVGLVI